MGVSIYEKKSDYVSRLNSVLDASEYFDGIDYAKDHIRGDEYIRIRNSIGDTYYINVTGNSEAAILMEVARFVNGIRPTGYVDNRDRRLAASKLFKRAV